MKAIAIGNFGNRDQLKLVELPKPVPGRGEVLVRVAAAGVNPVDAKIREGLLRARLPHQFPIVPGWDAAGVIEEVGAGCRRLKPGVEVYAYCRKPLVKNGAYAEYLVLAERNVAQKPSTLTMVEAAALPLAALTAYQSLFAAAGLKRGQTVLIHAGAGGVGGFAVQLAREAGARVISTASARNHAYVRDLGAEVVVDYPNADFVQVVRAAVPEGVDVAFDTVGGDVQVRSAGVVKPGGTLVSILAYADEAALQAKGIKTRYVFVAPNRRQLDRLARLAERGKLRVRLAAELPLEQAARAHELIESRHTCGKIVLRVP